MVARDGNDRCSHRAPCFVVRIWVVATVRFCTIRRSAMGRNLPDIRRCAKYRFQSKADACSNALTDYFRP